MRMFIVIVLLWIFLPAGLLDAAELASGDIAIIGFHSDAPDQFAWVTLVDLRGGDDIYFTDMGHDVPSAHTVSDGAIRYTVPAGGIPAGQVQLVNLDAEPLPQDYEMLEDPDVGPRMLAGSFGDQCAILTGFFDDPEYLFAINTNASSWELSWEPNAATESALYPGLVEGRNALALGADWFPGNEFDNVYYRGISRGTKDALFAAIADRRNWQLTDAPVGDITNGTLASGFSIVTSQGFVRGDANMDGLFDLGDAISMLTYLFGEGVVITCRDSMDVNDDGSLDLSDPVAFLTFLFSDGPAPGPPFPSCGPDGTEDPLDCESFRGC